jgi:hypothetical protein
MTPQAAANAYRTYMNPFAGRAYLGAVILISEMLMPRVFSGGIVAESEAPLA